MTTERESERERGEGGGGGEEKKRGRRQRRRETGRVKCSPLLESRKTGAVHGLTSETEREVEREKCSLSAVCVFSPASTCLLRVKERDAKRKRKRILL